MSEETRRPILLIANAEFGLGSSELGRILMRSFLKTVAHTEPKPERAIFMNAGVHLTTEGSELLEEIQALEKVGTQVLSCGTCLDYFRLKDKLKVGQITNMQDTVGALMAASHVIRP